MIPVLVHGRCAPLRAAPRPAHRHRQTPGRDVARIL